MAIKGDGFFVVDQDGQQALTRAGSFQLDPNGRLITATGQSVLSAEGAPIVMNPNLPWKLHDDGFLSQAGGGTYLGLAQPASLNDLVRAGDNLFRPVGPLQAVPLDQRHVMSGYLEQSAVRPAKAMMELIETSRAYETNIRMIQNQDQLTGSLVNRILR
jgi:flagellar basal body rod protein FlgG